MATMAISTMNCENLRGVGFEDAPELGHPWVKLPSLGELHPGVRSDLIPLLGGQAGSVRSPEALERYFFVVEQIVKATGVTPVSGRITEIHRADADLGESGRHPLPLRRQARLVSLNKVRPAAPNYWIHLVIQLGVIPRDDTSAIALSCRREKATVREHLPALLLLVGQERRICNRKPDKALSLINIPKRCGLVIHRNRVVSVIARPFVQLHIAQAVFDSPFDVAGECAPLLASRQLGEITQFRIKPNRRDFRPRQLASAFGFLRVVSHACHFTTCKRMAYKKNPPKSL